MAVAAGGVLTVALAEALTATAMAAAGTVIGNSDDDDNDEDDDNDKDGSGRGRGKSDNLTAVAATQRWRQRWTGVAATERRDVGILGLRFSCHRTPSEDGGSCHRTLSA